MFLRRKKRSWNLTLADSYPDAFKGADAVNLSNGKFCLLCGASA
jgi:hypothetical protein